MTDSGFSPASANRREMSSCKALLETVGTLSAPLFTLQPDSAQHNIPAAARIAVDGYTQPPGVC
jgi:hypothetical protein